MSSGSSNSTIISSQNTECGLFNLSFSLEITKILTVSILSLSSVIGNTFIIFMVYKRKELRKTTNFFIVNMAVSDLFYPLTGITATISSTSLASLPWEMTNPTARILCHHVSFFQGVSLTVSIESLVCVSLDRFVAVVFPIKVHLITAKVRAIAITFTWFIAVLLNSVEFFMPVCSYRNTSTFYINFGRVRTTFLFAVPLIIIAISYCAIAITLRKQDKALQSRHRRSNQRKQQAIKMSLCVMMAFYLLTLPSLIVANLLPRPEVLKSCSLFKTLWLLVQLALYTSSTVNPIICITFVQSFRRGLTKTLTSCYRKRQRERRKSNQQEIRLERFRIIPA